MASESETEKRETLADIVAEMRRREKSHYYPKVARNIMHQYSDRIEAAWRREKTEIGANALAVGGIVEAARHKECGTPTTEKSSAVGNAAAMHTALKGLDEEMTFCERNVELGIGFALEGLREHCRIVRQILNAALSAPARNCDAMPWRKAWDEWRAKHHPQNPQTFNESYEATVAFMEWFTAPSAEKGATA